MCQSVTIDGFYTGQVQQMADRLSVKPRELIWYERPRKFDGGYKFCLCPIDLEATAKKFGYAFDRDDWGDGVFTKSE